MVLIQLQLHFHLANIFHVSMTQETASPWRVRREREREREISLCISLRCASMWLVYGRTRSWWSRKVEKTDSRESMLSIRSIYGTWTLANQPVHPFPSIPCTLLTDNYYFPLLKRVPVYFVQHRSVAAGVEGGGGMDAKACQTVITCNYRFRGGQEGVERTIEEKASPVEENFN